MSRVDNPFHKANPFGGNITQPFKHPAAYPRPPTDYSRIINAPYSDHQTSRVLDNNWVFNQNNLTKRADFTKKYERTDSKPTSFETHIKMAQVTRFRNEPPKHQVSHEANMENPFFRKNLLVDKQEVNRQVQLDISSYRPKAKTSYQPGYQYNSVREESPIVMVNRPSLTRSDRQNQPAFPPPLKVTQSNYVQDPGSNTLRYSKTPASMTQRQVTPPASVREDPQQAPPTTLQFHGKRFYLRSMQ